MPQSDQEIVHAMQAAILEFEFTLKVQSPYTEEPKIVAYLGTTEYKALINYVGKRCPLHLIAPTPNTTEWMGIRIIRVYEDTYFHVTEQQP